MTKRFEIGDKIKDKAGNRYEILQGRRLPGFRGKPEFLLRRHDGKERWIDEDIVESFSEHA